jgi:Sugar (and other) transporter
VASFYVIGAVTGALGFGWLTDRFGRRFVFYVTLIVYLTGVLLSSFAWDFWSFALFRMITGLGIGGEYAAVNSAIDELIPAKYRGRIDLCANRPHRQCQQDGERDLGNLGVEFLRDVFEHEHQQEKVEGIESPTQEAGRDNVPLLTRPTRQRLDAHCCYS